MTQLAAPASPRYSHERAAIDRLRALISAPSRFEIHSGIGSSNRLAVDGWDLVPRQYIQFGDLPYQAEDLTVVVEVESGGGVGNLVKYWPLLRGSLGERPFFLLHLFQVSSENDYIAHRELWRFLVERMQADLDAHDRAWGTAWLAEIGTYWRTSIDADMGRQADRVARVLIEGLGGAEAMTGQRPTSSSQLEHTGRRSGQAS